jgi:glycolate oxidase FAD binding subunit
MSSDLSQQLMDQVLAAAADGGQLEIQGGESKSFLGRTPKGDPLSTADHRGIISYEPKELVITARSGTPLQEIEAALAERGQMLPFDPPHFGPRATLGGTIAAGLSGSRRPYVGSARDFVLGARVLNGKGEILRFGGEVMKNVAGYDVSRLMTGAMGTLGVLLDISLKVLPVPAKQMTLVFNSSADSALKQFNAWSGKPLPISAAACDGERAYVRLSGAATAVDAAAETLSGTPMDEDADFWRDKLGEQEHAFFQGDQPLWRVSLPSSTPDGVLPGKCLIDWGGSLRWLRSDEPADVIFKAAQELGGHATLFKGGDRESQIYQPLPQAILSIHQNLKKSFDPQGIFNPGRLYAEL